MKRTTDNSYRDYSWLYLILSQIVLAGAFLLRGPVLCTILIVLSLLSTVYFLYRIASEMDSENGIVFVCTLVIVLDIAGAFLLPRTLVPVIVVNNPAESYKMNWCWKNSEYSFVNENGESVPMRFQEGRCYVDNQSDSILYHYSQDYGQGYMSPVFGHNDMELAAHSFTELYSKPDYIFQNPPAKKLVHRSTSEVYVYVLSNKPRPGITSD